METDVRKLSSLIEEADALVDQIRASAGGMQVVEQNVVRMKACLKMLRIGIVEPLETGG
jgi:hypothetical protein